MIEYNALLMFISASLLLAFAPGPDNIFVLSQSIAYGRSTGIKITLGLCTGLIVHTVIVALGVSVIFRTSLIAFNILKYAGAAYLLYLSILTFRHASKSSDLKNTGESPSLHLYRRGIIMNITNPKVSIFFMAFLPQFANPGNGSMTLQLFLLGLIFIAVTMLVFGLISFLAGAIGKWLSQSARFEKILNLFAGTVLAALAVTLATTRQ
ncbi:MAG: threonine transporter RhtB [Spirochaetae bacterium HGW-Spirochaetae-1]|jgi:threonine/homoserine/homoserine lactone efflux protein|nr:MAG: threonine transporter RhtB [Spirochaetae bacterium HGW-Spirochaetae-1]